MRNIDGWVLLSDFCEKYSQRENTVHARVSAGLWPRGEYYSSPDGSLGYIHEAKALAWLEEKGRLPPGTARSLE